MQTLPRSTRSYQAARRAEIGAAVSSVRRQWSRVVTDEFDASFAAVLPGLLGTVELASSRVVDRAIGYVPDVLEETGQSRYLAPVGEVVPGAFAGVDGSGRPTAGLLGYSTVVAKGQVGQGATARQATMTAGAWLGTAVGTLLSDIARAAEAVQMGNHRVGGYVRALSLPSCSRCAILAGRWYADSVAFQRHPRCDCLHVPASKAFADEFVLDSRQYFDSLAPEQQDKIFTQAGAEAIREGADINQVVNARRGMKSAQIGGRDVLVTTEGTTRRGLAYDVLAARGGTVTTVEGSAIRHTRSGPELRNVRTTRARRPRMMPETLREVATGREDFIRLLKANGYIR